jgi:adenylylsulfate reductase subunit A
MGLGAKLVNSHGEAFMERYHELGDKAPRNVLVYGCLTEIREGRGPIYLDCRGIPKERLDHLIKTLGLDKDTLPDYFHQKDLDLSKELLEISVSEGMLTGPSEVIGSGIKIDEHCMSSIPGIFAAGDCSDQMKCVHMAVAGGYAAGKNAYEYARQVRLNGEISERELEEEMERFIEPLYREEGISYMEFEDVLRKIMSEHVGAFRTEKGLKAGIVKLKRLKKDAEHLKAENRHELLRVMESKNLLTIGEIMAHAALFRRESRFIPYHYRLDYPETDNDGWCGQVVVYRENGEIRCEFERISYEG